METQNTFAPSAPERNEFIWRLAKKRAGFQKHLIVYGLVNTLLFAIWGFTVVQDPSESRQVWPLLVMFWWGLGLAVQGITAYSSPGIFDEQSIAEREYEKLIKR